MKKITSITILYKERLSLKMFTDFLKTLYLGELKTKIYPINGYDTEERAKDIIKNIDSSMFNLILVKTPKVLNLENKVLVYTFEIADVAISLNPGVLEKIDTIKVKPDFIEEWGSIDKKWIENINRLANLK
jgi:hypothetical protein